MSEKIRRRSPRGENRRAAIITAAAQEFAKHGYHGASIAAIAAQVGITQAGILHHYASKDALLDAVVQQRFAEDAEIVTRLGLGEASPFAGYDSLVARNIEDPTWVQFLMVITAEGLTEDNPARELIRVRYERVRERILQRMQAHAGDRYDLPAWLDREDVASLLLAALDGLQLQWLYEPSVDLRRRMALLIDLITNAPELSPGETASRPHGDDRTPPAEPGTDRGTP
ncbi:TetR/AcrR family transcriptional regulator [Kineococcus esterisolvens]|uniref:TetR/AcrR family transcriptional regulator n=1 Tax=unclassified Kineococcus TaxID=2621656 RepID=UPI003D7CF88A